jgi:ABC-type multidrug transport system ATPase subunit
MVEVAMFEIKNLDIGFSHNVLVSRASFNFKTGNIYAVLGDNGAGKTTFIKTLSGFTRPLSGTIYFEKNPLLNWSLDKKSKFFSILFSRNDIDSTIKVREIFEFSLSQFFKDVEISDRFKKIINFFEMKHLLDRPFGVLSDGQKQLVLIARSFIKPAKIYLLDEPTIYLDVKTKDLLVRFIREDLIDKDKIVILISHDSFFIEKCSDVKLQIDRGVLSTT